MDLRTLKQAAARILPEAVKAPFRARLFGYRAPKVRLRVEMGMEGGERVARVDGGPVLRLTPEVEEDAAYHFRDNGDAMEEMHAFLAAARERPGVLFDAGAHRGLFALVYTLADPRSRAFAYEPSPVLRGGMGRLMAMNGVAARVDLRPEALGDEEATVDAWADAQGFFRTDPAPAGVEHYAARFTSLDAEARARGVWPDVVKIDVEGFEAEVLRGAGEVLARRPILFLELHMDVLERRGIAPRTLVEQVAAHGYHFESCAGRPLTPRAVWGSPRAVQRVVGR